MSIRKITLIVLAMSSFLFADIELKRVNYIAKNVGKVVDIELIIQPQNSRLMVISVMTPSKNKQARDARFRTVEGYENIMLGLATNLHNWGKIKIRNDKLIVLKDVKITDGLTVYIDDESLVIYKKPQKPEKGLRKFREQYERKIQELENVIAAQNDRINALEDSNASILQTLQHIEQQIQQSHQPLHSRQVVFDISYDVPPLENSYTVTVSMVNDPESTRVLQQNDTLTPGLYSVEISMPGYDTLQYDFHVEAVESPVTIQQQLQVKPRRVAFDITTNNNQEVSDCEVTLTPVDSEYWTAVEENETVKPGWYFLNIKKDGYLFEKKKIHIFPADVPYVITENLSAAKRQISFNVRDKSSGAIVNPHAIIDLSTNKPMTINSWYAIDTKLKLRFTFQEYASIDKDITITSGTGPYVVDVWLHNRWKKMEFTVRYKQMEINGIKYQYNFYTDGNAVEDHHISTRNVNGYTYYQVMIPHSAVNFRAQLGYMYMEMPTSKFVSGMTLGRLQQTDVSTLVSHLQQLHNNGKNYEAAITALESMLQGRRFRRRWQSVSSQDKEKLMQHLYSWRIKNGQWRIRLQIIIYALKKS